MKKEGRSAIEECSLNGKISSKTLTGNEIAYSAEFFEQFKIRDSLGLVSDKAVLFTSYFAYYHVLGRIDEASQFLNNPTSNYLKDTSLVGSIVFKDFKEYIPVAEESAKRLKKCVGKWLKNSMRADEDTSQSNMSLQQIAEAAKLMATAVVKHEFYKTSHDRLRLDINKIKNKYNQLINA